MKWQIKERLGENYKAEKDNGLKAYVYKNALRAGYYLNQKNPGCDVRYKGGAIAGLQQRV